ncbi:hypothetical protein [Mediterraneibacter faecis]
MVKVKNQGKYQKSTKWENYNRLKLTGSAKKKPQGAEVQWRFLRGNVKA